MSTMEVGVGWGLAVVCLLCSTYLKCLKCCVRSTPAVTMEEVRVAWNRFRLLNPDEYGCVSRDVFRRPPYSNNMFCKQVGVV